MHRNNTHQIHTATYLTLTCTSQPHPPCLFQGLSAQSSPPPPIRRTTAASPSLHLPPLHAAARARARAHPLFQPPLCLPPYTSTPAAWPMPYVAAQASHPPITTRSAPTPTRAPPAQQGGGTEQRGASKPGDQLFCAGVVTMDKVGEGSCSASYVACQGRAQLRAPLASCTQHGARTQRRPSVAKRQQADGGAHAHGDDARPARVFQARWSAVRGGGRQQVSGHGLGASWW